jgi:hypothetical protein
MATMPLDTQQQHAQQVHATIVPFTPIVQRSGTLRTSAPERAQIPELAMVVAYNGWTGTQTIYLRPKKKKRKPCSKKKKDTDESSDVDDGGWTREREVKLATLQAKPQEESQPVQLLLYMKLGDLPNKAYASSWLTAQIGSCPRLSDIYYHKT